MNIERLLKLALCQSIYVNTRLSSYRERYPHLDILIDIICQPNPRNLFLRFKNKVKNDNKFAFAGNNVNCDEEFESEMKQILKKLMKRKGKCRHLPTLPNIILMILIIKITL